MDKKQGFCKSDKTCKSPFLYGSVSFLPNSMSLCEQLTHKRAITYQVLLTHHIKIFMKKTYWYWNRLKCMPLPEIPYRLQKTVYNHLQQAGFFLSKKIPLPDYSISGNSFIGKPNHIQKSFYCNSAKQILQGKIQIFNTNHESSLNSWNWNRDPLTKVVAPLVFGKLLDYRDPSLVGNIKYLWEPNRHLHLVTLAQAYYLTKDGRYLSGIKDQLDLWFTQCPYPLGPNWTSSLELGIRLINWSFVWQLIGGRNSPLFDNYEGSAFLQRWMVSVYQHIHFIKGYFSKYSSANNHLIGEAAGLLVASITWPYWKNHIQWRDLAKNLLEREALLQNGADGVNKEQAISYQQFVLDFLIIAALAGQANQVIFSDAYWIRIEKMLEYLASIMDYAGNVPMIGDADDGFVVTLSKQQKWCPYKSLLATGSILFNRGDFKAKSKTLDDKTRWLLGVEAEQKYPKIYEKTSGLPIRNQYPIGGYYIMGCDFETTDEIRILVDAGPLGYREIAAHGHADALSFTLSVAGLEFLIDPGTFAYHTEQKWRDYFRGTSAHNTIRVDGLDQSVSGGNFMWLQKANARADIWKSEEMVDHFIGRHDGYLRLDDPVTHKREIKFLKKYRKLFIEDTLECKKQHVIECFWHFSEACRVKKDGNIIKAINADHSIDIKMSNYYSEIEIFEESFSPPAGWISRNFHIKAPSSTVTAKSTINDQTTFVTEIICR